MSSSSSIAPPRDMCIGSFQEGQLVDAPLWHGAVGTPLHAFVERLMLVGAEECPWKAFLPVLLRERGACEEVLARARADTARRLGQLGDVSLSGRIWKMSRDACGCRLVQSALDKAATDQEKEALTYELHGHVWEAIHCPHANHVLQKVVVLLRPEALQFVVQELLAGGAINASRHKYGCRVVQRLIEYCPPHQTCGIVDALLQELTSVAGHPYGNYVIQKAVQHGLQVHQQFIVSAIKADIGSFATDPNLSAVLGAAIEHCDAHSAELAAMLVEDCSRAQPLSQCGGERTVGSWWRWPAPVWGMRASATSWMPYRRPTMRRPSDCFVTSARRFGPRASGSRCSRSSPRTPRGPHSLRSDVGRVCLVDRAVRHVGGQSNSVLGLASLSSLCKLGGL